MSYYDDVNGSVIYTTNIIGTWIRDTVNNMEMWGNLPP